MILVEIAGFLGADAEERFTTSGKRVVSLRVGTKLRHNGQDETIWWRVSIWDERFDKMLPYLKKGSPVIVVGEMGLPETYIDRNGQTKVSMSMRGEMLKFSPFGKSERQGESQPAASSNSPYETTAAGYEMPVGSGVEVGAGNFDMDLAGDDLPF